MKKIGKSFVVQISILLQISLLLYPSLSYAANLTTVKNTLQSSRMSFSGRVKSPTAAGSSNVWIYTATSGIYTSVSTAGLKPGDSVRIGATNTYTIVSIVDADEFTVTPVLAAGDADDGTDPIFYKAVPKQMITFNTASAVESGFFQVLIAAGAAGNDNIPDITGFDFNGGPTATASSVTGYAFSAGVATAAGSAGCTAPANYHCFEFHYTGTGVIGAGILLTIGLQDGTNTMIAPAPSASRVANTADAYTYIVKNFVNGSNPESATPADISTGKIAVIEPVRVTATVEPSITFKIEGVAASQSTCSLTTDVTTTATSVPFGVLSLDTFRVGTQKITVSTNAASGYSVTAIENERLSNLAAVPSYIPNTLCDSGACTFSGAGSAWATAAAHAGFGYTLDIVSGTPTIIPTVGNFRPFASLAANEPPTQIISNAGVASSQAVHVCYKISVDATQPAGDYENQVTYTATASF